LVSSSGGVLLDLLALEPWWSRYRVIWAAVRAADTESLLTKYPVEWIDDVSLQTLPRLLPSVLHAWRILRRHRPRLVVSAGSGPAVAFFLVARLFGIPTFWLSTLNVVATPGLTARICARLASRVLLQQPSLQAALPNGVVIGELY
jgi:UDP-N-acetylglucosamine:LPS N-acetylglucosamine transferase